MSHTDRELKHLWRRYQTALEEASRCAKALTILEEAMLLDEYANRARGLAEAFKQAVDKKSPAFDQIKNIIGSG